MSDQEQQKVRMESLVKYVEGLLSKKEIEEAFIVGIKEGLFGVNQDYEKSILFEYKRGKYTYQIYRINTVLLEQQRAQRITKEKSQNQIMLDSVLNWNRKRGVK